MKKFYTFLLKIIAFLLILSLIYLLTLCYPQVFFKNKVSVGNITVYSDENIPQKEMTVILKKVQENIQKSEIYNSNTKHRIFIANNPIRWKYFSNLNDKVGGLNYVLFNHNIFLRKTNIPENRLYNHSGTQVSGDRTLDYFIAHEIAHTLEFQSMTWYKYPIKTDWIIEGYAEYIAHGSQDYESSLANYLAIPESDGGKYYARVETMVSYLLEQEHIPIEEIWMIADEYDTTLESAISENTSETDDN